MTGTSPGQAAHAAYVAARFPTPNHAGLAWKARKEFTDDQRDAWETAARAAITAGAPDGLPAALDAALAGRCRLRQLADEITRTYLPSGSGHVSRTGQVQITKWRERAGIERPA